MRDPSRAIWLLYRSEVRRVSPRFSRSLISPAAFVVLALLGSGSSATLAIIAIGATLALGMVAEASQLARDRDGTVLVEMSRLPLSGELLAIARLASAATFAIAGTLVAAGIALVLRVDAPSAAAFVILQPSMVLRAVPVAVFGSMLACAVAARLPLGRAIALAVIATIVVSRIPYVERLAAADLRAAFTADAVPFSVPIGFAALAATGLLAWRVLVRALQPRRLRALPSRLGFATPSASTRSDPPASP